MENTEKYSSPNCQGCCYCCTCSTFARISFNIINHKTTCRFLTAGLPLFHLQFRNYIRTYPNHWRTWKKHVAVCWIRAVVLASYQRRKDISFHTLRNSFLSCAQENPIYPWKIRLFSRSYPHGTVTKTYIFVHLYFRMFSMEVTLNPPCFYWNLTVDGLRYLCVPSP